MSVVMPLAALWISIVFELHQAVKIALVTIALSPVPPFLPGKTLKAGGPREFTIGLLVATSLLAIVVVPLSVWLLGRFLGVPFHISSAHVARIVAVTTLVPLLAGTATRRFAPELAARIAKPVSIGAMIMLVAALVPILFSAWPAIKTLLGDGAVLAIIAITVFGLGVGHFLGGPDRDDRTVLALATSARHPAVALAIANATYPGQKLATAAILLDVIVSAVVAAPYVKRSTASHASHAGSHVSDKSDELVPSSTRRSPPHE